MYAKNIRSIAKRKFHTERSTKIESRALDALKFASEASYPKWMFLSMSQDFSAKYPIFHTKTCENINFQTWNNVDKVGIDKWFIAFRIISIHVKNFCSLNPNQSNLYWLNQWFAFSLIRQWKKYFSLVNQWKQYYALLKQLIFTAIISEICLNHSNLFLAIWIGQISLIISRFLLIQI